MVCRGWDERMKQGKNQEREQTKRNQKEEPNKEKPPASIEGKMILAGGKILRLRSERELSRETDLRMTAESRGENSE